MRGQPWLFPKGRAQPEVTALQGEAPAAVRSFLSSCRLCLRIMALSGAGPDQEGCSGSLQTHWPGGEYGRVSSLEVAFGHLAEGY